MLALNITLFIQMIHFWIIFYLLTRWLWRPALKLIVKEETEQESLEDKISVQQKVVENNEQRRDRLWDVARQQFAQTIPSLQSVIAKPPKKRAYEVLALDEDQKKDIVQSVSKFIVSEADHV